MAVTGTVCRTYSRYVRRKVGRFRQWADDFFRLSGATDIPEDEAAERWRGCTLGTVSFAKLIAERREHPTEDMISDLVHAKSERRNAGLTDNEVLQHSGVVSAGADTTGILITTHGLSFCYAQNQWEH